MGWGAQSRESPGWPGFVNPGGNRAQQRCRAVPGGGSEDQGKDGAWTADGSGNYVTIWRRQGNGSWKVAVDIGNADPVAPPSGRR